MIDLAALQSLRAVDEHGSVVAAAEALGFTPSAVSQQVKRLERQAGVALLERVGRGVLLTGAGRRLVDDGGRLLADLERVEADLHAFSRTVAGHVRLACFSTAMRGLAAPAARRLLDAHPGLRVSLSEEEPWDAVDLVARGRVEVAVAHSWGDVALTVPEHVVATLVGHDPAHAIVRRDHRLAARGTVRAEDLADEDWVATPPGTICREWLERMHDGTGRRPRIAHQSREFESHLALVAAGLGIALVPRLGRAALGADLVALTVTDPEPTRTVTALHRRTLAGSPAVGAVLAALRRTWTDLA
ncbi:MAG TPA: LysR substrate-binding domain-containing protein [Nocardioides sp.]